MSIITNDTHSIKYLPDIQEIMRPLALLDLIHFKFTLFLPNNKRVTFCNDPDWLIHFYKEKFHLIGDFDIEPDKIHPGRYIWDHLPTVHESPVARSACDDYHFSHGCSIVQHHLDRTYSYDFAAKNTNWCANNIYINAFDCIERFIHYFNDKAQEIIVKAIKNPLEIMEKPTKCQKTLHPIFNKDLFLKNTNIQRFYFRGSSALHYLTPREQDCLHLLNNGFSRKRVAQILNISLRTVEYHLKTAIVRCGCYSVEGLQKMVSNQLIL